MNNSMPQRNYAFTAQGIPIHVKLNSVHKKINTRLYEIKFVSQN